MKPMLYLSLIIGMFAFSSNNAIIDPLPIGSKLPKADVSMTDISGKTVTLQSAMQENGLLVMFSCNTCPVVVNNESRTVGISKFALENKVGVILVNPNEAIRDKGESLDDMKAYAKKVGYSWYYSLDKDHVLADAFGATKTPECFLFNKEGVLVYTGAIDDNPNDAESVNRIHLQEAIKELVNGKDVSVTKSRSIGCSIKRLN